MRRLFACVLVLGVMFEAHAQQVPKEIAGYLQEYTCNNCHNLVDDGEGPSYTMIVKKGGQTAQQFEELLYKPKPTNWPGYMPMPPASYMPPKVAKKIVAWMLTLAPKIDSTAK